jgi:hypothetical protein
VLWTIKEAAAWAGVGERKMARLLASGTIPSFLLPAPSRQRRVRSEDIEARALSRPKDPALEELAP